MFPVKYKSKISKKLSYPLGAEYISMNLSKLPQSEFFDISFSSYNQNYLLRDKIDKYPVLSLDYSYFDRGIHGTKEVEEKGRYQPTWQITAHCVPQTCKMDYPCREKRKSSTSIQQRSTLLRSDPLFSLSFLTFLCSSHHEVSNISYYNKNDNQDMCPRL